MDPRYETPAFLTLFNVTTKNAKYGMNCLFSLSLLSLEVAVYNTLPTR